MGRKSKRKSSVKPHGPAPSGTAAERGDFSIEIVDDVTLGSEVLPGGGKGFQSAASTVSAPEPGPFPAAAEPVGVATVERPADDVAEAAPSPAAPAAAAPAAAPAAPTSAPMVTLGELLLTAREARGLSLEEASARTRISAPMLRHLENDRFSEFQAEAYVRGFLRNYGTFLGLDVGMLLRRYEAIGGRRVEPTPEIWEEVVVPESPRQGWKPGRALGIGAGVLALGLAGVGVWKLAERGASLHFRSGAGLEQIETELRDANPAGATPSPGSSPAPSGAAEGGTSATAPAPGGTVPGPAVPAVGAVPVVQPGQQVQSAGGATIPPKYEDTSPGPRSKSPVTDLLEERPVRPGDVHATANAPARLDLRSTPATESSPLVLTVTALDSAEMRLQIDDDASRAQRFSFQRRGESRTWTARQSFKVSARRAPNLELRLNGKLVVLPQGGRSYTFDRASVSQGTARREVPPLRAAATSRRRNRPRPYFFTPPAAPRSASPEHAAGPPR